MMQTFRKQLARVRSEERGVAMVVAIGTIMVLLTLTALVAEGSLHASDNAKQDRFSKRGRSSTVIRPRL